MACVFDMQWIMRNNKQARETDKVEAFIYHSVWASDLPCLGYIDFFFI